MRVLEPARVHQHARHARPQARRRLTPGARQPRHDPFRRGSRAQRGIAGKPLERGYGLLRPALADQGEREQLFGLGQRRRDIFSAIKPPPKRARAPLELLARVHVIAHRKPRLAADEMMHRHQRLRGDGEPRLVHRLCKGPDRVQRVRQRILNRRVQLRRQRGRESQGGYGIRSSAFQRRDHAAHVMNLPVVRRDRGGAIEHGRRLGDAALPGQRLRRRDHRGLEVGRVRQRAFVHR